MVTQAALRPDVPRWRQIVDLVRNGNAKPPRRVERSDAEWRAILTDEQYRVTRRKDTERPFSSALCSLFEPGLYRCVCCDTPIFDSTSKFDAGTGWPSFAAPIAPDVVRYVADDSYGTPQIEANCNVCDAHLGHVYPDGPPPSGLRFCINAVSLRKEQPAERQP